MRCVRPGSAVLLALLLLFRCEARAAADRPALVLLLCAGNAADVARGLRGIETAAPSDPDWGRKTIEAYADHTLTCPPDDHLAMLPSLRARRLIDEADATIALFATGETSGRRLAAVQTLANRTDTLPADLLPAALAHAREPRVAAALRVVIVEAGLHAPELDRRLSAIRALGSDATERNAYTLAALRADHAYAADRRIRAALDDAGSRVRFWLHVGDVLALLYNGVSAGSVLFMSSVGLAIIFGLMGVINLAQGELIMIGAYVTFCVQEVLRTIAPGWTEWYPLIAIPIVFAVTGLVGIAIEAAVIRHLYRRPLMTLLATWAISLLLINLVRVVFGTQNIEFVTPPYLTGGDRIVGEFLVTWNHAVAIGAAVTAYAVTAALLRFTRLGLSIRAVTQNRAMAGCVGISTRRVDMAAFGFGAGLAGLAGLALSPIYNVNPSMGTGFIIDSFMVVVLGGVGSLFGTAIASLGIGLVDVGIEPFYGAVAAKVIALLLIIAIIQRRPEGLVPARGRR